MENFVQLVFVGIFLSCLACSSTDSTLPDAGLDALDGTGQDAGDSSGDLGADPGEESDGADMPPSDSTDEDALDCSEHVFEDVMIPMRDGESLSAFIRRPVQAGCRLPTVLIQTPYDKQNARNIWFGDDGDEPLFSSKNYAFVVEDWRGFFGSQDAAVEPPMPYGEDGHDTVEWIATQDWSDGNIGTWGVSALCVQQYRTAMEHPAHLKAAVPIFCQMNTTYDQYYPGGVLRQEYYDFISAYFGGGDIVIRHPYHDLVWRNVENTHDAADVQIPMLIVSGWYDLYDTASIRDFRNLRDSTSQPVQSEHRLLIGPWIHAAVGGETSGGRPLDEQELHYYDSDKKIQSDSLAFFDKHLRGISSPADNWKAVHWVTGGVRVEQEADSWPPQGPTERFYYLSQDNLMDTTAPSDGQVQFPYDPDDPSPTVGGCTLYPSQKHGPRHQDDVLARDDVLVFDSTVLNTTLSIRGVIQAHLKVSTTGNDTDFAIRLTDVDQQGKHLLVGEGIQRLKLRDGFDRPVQVQPGEVYDVLVTLTSELAYDFAEGHRIGLLLTSSNYKRFARNPNNGDDFYEDEAGSLSVLNTLHLGAGTYLSLPVMSDKGE